MVATPDRELLKLTNNYVIKDMPPLRSGNSVDNKICVIEVVSTCNAASKKDDTGQSVR
jgi:hypothetical protein